MSLDSLFPTFRGSVPASSLRVEISRYAALHIPVERLAKLRHCADISKLTKDRVFSTPTVVLIMFIVTNKAPLRTIIRNVVDTLPSNYLLACILREIFAV